MGYLEDLTEEQEEELLQLEDDPAMAFAAKRLHNSLLITSREEAASAVHSTQRLHHSMSCNLNPDAHPELDIDTARDFISQLAGETSLSMRLSSSLPQSLKTPPPSTQRRTPFRQKSTMSSDFTDILVLSEDEKEDEKTNGMTKRAPKHRDSLLSYDYTEVVVEDEEGFAYLEEEVIDETENGEETIFEEEILDDDEVIEEIVEEEEV